MNYCSLGLDSFVLPPNGVTNCHKNHVQGWPASSLEEEDFGEQRESSLSFEGGAHRQSSIRAGLALHYERSGLDGLVARSSPAS